MATTHVATLDGQRVSLDENLIDSFQRTFHGQLITPPDPDYDDARRVWNGMIDKHPALIARCTGTADVVAAVNFARENNLFLAVRGGGHNVAGNAVCDNGMVIDLSPMKGIHVDPARRTARVQPGATWRDLDHETQLHGLMTPGGQMSLTGVAGFTLAGGMGYTRRKWGLALDNLRSVEIVTANGQVITASEAEHADLFWAARGGGGNFGVVTSFEFQLHALGPMVHSILPIFALENAPNLLRSWRDYLEQAPEEVTADVIFWRMLPLPDLPAELNGAPIMAIAGMYAGPAEEGERVLQPLRELDTPLLDLSHTGRYVDHQSAIDAFFPDTQRYYWKSIFIDHLDDDVIDAMVALVTERPSPATMLGLRGLGGAISRVPDEATAYANRAAGYNLSIDTTWSDPTDDERMITWTRDAWSRMHELTDGGVYLNFAGLGEDAEALARAGHQRNYEKLQQVKRMYDPMNLFRGNINIKP